MERVHMSEAVLGADRHLWVTLAILFGEFALVSLILLVAVRILAEILLGRVRRPRREHEVELRNTTHR
jgi:hypothetical protein